MPVYRGINDPDRLLLFYPWSKKWVLVRTANKGTDLVAMFLTCDFTCLPENAPQRSWQVDACGNGTQYQLQANVHISIASAEGVAAASLALSVKNDGFKVKLFYYYLLFILLYILRLNICFQSIFCYIINLLAIAKAHHWSYRIQRI